MFFIANLKYASILAIAALFGIGCQANAAELDIDEIETCRHISEAANLIMEQRQLEMPKRKIMRALKPMLVDNFAAEILFNTMLDEAYLYPVFAKDEIAARSIILFSGKFELECYNAFAETISE